MARGTVKWFNADKGYGFIAVDGGRDVFFHFSSVEGHRFIEEGQRVEFEIGESGVKDLVPVGAASGKLSMLGDDQASETGGVVIRRISDAEPAGYLADSDNNELAISIYISDENISIDVQAAIETLARTADLDIYFRGDPIIGSWFRLMRARTQKAFDSPVGREISRTAAHVTESRLALAQDASVTATMMQNLGPVIGALQPTRDAVIRVGALLIVKVDWAVSVFQLSASQQLDLDHQSVLAMSPKEIIAALQLTPNTETKHPDRLD